MPRGTSSEAVKQRALRNATVRSSHCGARSRSHGSLPKFRHLSSVEQHRDDHARDGDGMASPNGVPESGRPKVGGFYLLLKQ